MKANSNFLVTYILLIICQVVMSNFTNLGPYIMLTILPAAVLCTPTSIGTAGCMFMAFISGLAVDWLSEGLLGINAASLVVVAGLREWIIKIIFGDEIITRGNSISIKRNGLEKVAFALVSITAVFLIVYILLDGAGTNPFWFGLAKFTISLILNSLLGLLVTKVLTTEERK